MTDPALIEPATEFVAPPAVARVVFACVENAGRSQMAAALFGLLADPHRAEATSAGTDAAPEVHPAVVTAMAELGVDLALAHPRYLTDEIARSADLMITMGCGDACPVVAGLERMDWPLDDPKGRPIEEVRKIRDEIRGRVEALLAERGWRRG